MAKNRTNVTWNHPWTKRQFLMIGGGIGVIVLGFVLLATGMGSEWDNPLAVDIAPVVLVLGYCIVIPLAIMYGGKDREA